MSGIQNANQTSSDRPVTIIFLRKGVGNLSDNPLWIAKWGLEYTAAADAWTHHSFQTADSTLRDRNLEWHETFCVVLDKGCQLINLFEMWPFYYRKKMGPGIH